MACVETSFHATSGVSSRSSVTSSDPKHSPLIKLFVKPYRGKRMSASTGVYSTMSLQKVIHLFLVVFCTDSFLRAYSAGDQTTGTFLS